MWPDQIQAFVKSRIESHPAIVGIPWQLGTAQIPGGVTLDDGLYPKTPGLEAQLSTYGLAIVAWRIGCFGLKDVVLTGTANELIHIPVVIQENEKVNRTPANFPNATGLVAERAAEYVKQAVSGFPLIRGSNKFTPIVLWHEPWEDFGILNGLRTIVVNFVKEHRINPLQE
jgi:hypothetical protein